MEVSQAAVNRAGQPDHPDLYVYDIDDALDNLGVCYEASDESVTGVFDFVAWVKDQLAAGYPVLCGVKIYPDEHPDWSLDHFVLAVGYDEEGLVLNTQLDLDGQVVIVGLPAQIDAVVSANSGAIFPSSTVSDGPLVEIFLPVVDGRNIEIRLYKLVDSISVWQAVEDINFTEAEVEEEDGQTVYVLEGTADGKEYEIEVTADGKVLEVEQESMFEDMFDDDD